LTRGRGRAAILRKEVGRADASRRGYMASDDHWYKPEQLRAMDDERLVSEFMEAVAAYAPAARGLVITMMASHDAARVRDLKGEMLRRLALVPKTDGKEKKT
jgi:hypothetical protein